MQSDLGIGIIGDNQTEITPFQRQVFEAQKAKEAREKEERMNDAKNGNSGGRQRNSAGGAGSPTASRSETVRYESDGERDDDVLEVI